MTLPLMDDRSPSSVSSPENSPFLSPTIAEQIRQKTIASEALLDLLDRYQLLPHLLRDVIIDQAIAAIECPPEALLSARQALEAQNHLRSDRDRTLWLARQGMTLEQWDAKIRRSLNLETFQRQRFDHQLKGYFLKRKKYLDRVTYSLLRTRDAHLVQELYFRIHAEEQTFAELARHYSQGPEARTNGLLGPVPLSTMSPPLAEALSSLRVGELTQPIVIGEWTLLLRLEEWCPAQFDDESIQRQLLNELFEHWVTQQIQGHPDP